jgi:homospermidine synthase
MRSIEHNHRFDWAFRTNTNKGNNIKRAQEKFAKSACRFAVPLLIFSVFDTNRKFRSKQRANALHSGYEHAGFCSEKHSHFNAGFEHSASGMPSLKQNGQNQLHRNIRLEFLN